MKNSAVAVLLSVTLAFAAFIGGFYTGKNSINTRLEIYGVSSTLPVPSTTASTSASLIADTEPTTPASPAASASTTVPSSPTASTAATAPTEAPIKTEPTVSSEPPSTSPATNATEPTSSATVPAASAFPININTATLDELDLLPGIGPVLAQRILDYRTEIGEFSYLEELMDVKGIGEKTFAKLLEYITL